MNTTGTINTRSLKQTVQIPHRTLAECAARYAALRAAEQLGLPADPIMLER
jgi:predicted solute-binding protein